MQITELAGKLQSLGLNDKEAKVYVAGLFLGPAPVQKIAEQAGINRATTYVILDQLAELGLVSQSTEDKKTVFITEGPEALGRLFDRQKELIVQRSQELKELMPELDQAQRKESGSAPVVRFYKGTDGIRSMSGALRRKAKPNTVVYGMTNVDEVKKIFPAIMKENPQFRLKKKLASKSFHYSVEGELQSDEKLLRETVRVDTPIMADINLYDDSATFLSYRGKDSVGIIMESPEIVGALRQLFELAWENQAK